MVNRIVKFTGPHGPRSFEVAYEALATYRPSKGQYEEAEAALAALDAVSVVKEKTVNPDLVLKTVLADVTVVMSEAERDVILAAIEATQFPTFALLSRRRTMEILKNAEAVAAN